MSREQPTINKEKEPTLENIKEYFQNEAEACSKKNREHLIDPLLHLKLAERWREINGYKKHESGGKKEKLVPGLMDKLEKRDYEPCLCYIEEILGNGGAEQETSTYDLINHKEYDSQTFKNREKDINQSEYQQRKNYLRKLADSLTGDLYKKRKSELNENLSPQNILSVLERVANRFEGKTSQLNKEFKQGDYRKVLEVLDRKIYQQSLRSKRNSEQKLKKKTQDERLCELHKQRRYFLNLKNKSNRL